MKSFYTKIYNRKNLLQAWRKVYENGIKSKSEATRNEIKDFAKDIANRLEIIHYQLKKREFRFLPCKGIAARKPGKKKPRPLVVAPIPNRIVQRSILNVLQKNSAIKKYISVETSFGGLKDIGVKHAIEMIHKAIISGAPGYVRTDIQNFFSDIPRENVLETIANFIHNPEFNTLLNSALCTELDNLAELGSHKDLFPLDNDGVAQGSCLSPLIGNILLHDFDLSMNKRGILCIRYIDDILIIGKLKKVRTAFESARKILEGMGLTVYDPFEQNDKAKYGETKNGIEFLGCEISLEYIRPSKKAQKKLLEKIDGIFQESIQLMRVPEDAFTKKKSLVDTLKYASNVIDGWGNQYSFCNDKNVVGLLDKEINVRIGTYLRAYTKAKSIAEKKNPKDVRRLLGVQLLRDCNSNPIIN